MPFLRRICRRSRGEPGCGAVASVDGGLMGGIGGSLGRAPCFGALRGWERHTQRAVFRGSIWHAVPDDDRYASSGAVTNRHVLLLAGRCRNMCRLTDRKPPYTESAIGPGKPHHSWIPGRRRRNLVILSLCEIIIGAAEAAS